MIVFIVITTLMELLMFARIVWQGEKIMYYEQEVHRIQSEREGERRKWREAKQKTSMKKQEAKIEQPS